MLLSWTETGEAQQSSHREASSSGMTSAPCACASTPPGSSASAAPSMLDEGLSAAAWAAASCASAPGARDVAGRCHSSAGDPRPAMAEPALYSSMQATAPQPYEGYFRGLGRRMQQLRHHLRRAVRGTARFHKDSVEQRAPSAAVYGDSQAAVSVQQSISRPTASLLVSL